MKFGKGNNNNAYYVECDSPDQTKSVSKLLISLSKTDRTMPTRQNCTVIGMYGSNLFQMLHGNLCNFTNNEIKETNLLKVLRLVNNLP